MIKLKIEESDGNDTLLLHLEIIYRAQPLTQTFQDITKNTSIREGKTESDGDPDTPCSIRSHTSLRISNQVSNVYYFPLLNSYPKSESSEIRRTWEEKLWGPDRSGWCPALVHGAEVDGFILRYKWSQIILSDSGRSNPTLSDVLPFYGFKSHRRNSESV